MNYFYHDGDSKSTSLGRGFSILVKAWLARKADLNSFFFSSFLRWSLDLSLDCSVVARSQLTATSSFHVQVILLPQPP